MNFTDEQIINCALISFKHLRIMAAYFAEEAGTPELFEQANQLFEELTRIQRSLYDKMIEENWMSVSAQTKSSIDKTAKNLRKTVNEMK